MKKIQLSVTKAQAKILLIVAVVVAAIGITGYLVWQQRAKKIELSTPKTVCSADIIKQASTALKENKAQALNELEAKIVKLNDYQKDQNCMYIVVRSAMAKGDIEATSQYLEVMKPAYRDNGYSKAFTVPVITYDELSKLANSLKQDYEQENKENAERMKEDSEVLNKIDEMYESRNR